MMGRTHAATGALAGLLIGRLIGLDTVPEVLPFAAVSAGYALVPDLDHPGATASRLLGPITGVVSAVLRAGSRGVYRLTKGRRDEDCDGTHRHLSHTLLFAVVLGGVCAVTTRAGGLWAVGAWLAFGLLLALDQLGRLALVAYAAGAGAWLPAVVAGTRPAAEAALASLQESAGWLGVAVALGCFTHCLGDALTRSGCPFLFPIPIAGETWYELRPPRWLRFRTGGGVERRAMYPLVVIACVVAVPGVVSYVAGLVGTATTAAAG